MENKKESTSGRSSFPETGTPRIIPLSEGSFTIDKTKLFVPFREEEHNLQDRPGGSLLVEVQPFAVITSRDVLLLDAGLGFTDPVSGDMQLITNLERAGIRPAQVTKVLMTHLHKDHAGGISVESDHSRLTFPNATYYIQRRELEYAYFKGMPSFMTSELDGLADAPNVQFLHEDEGTIDDYISYRLSGGHSPFHQVFWIRDGGQTIFFGGDETPQLQQMKIRYKTKYDHDPEKAMQLRQQFWEQGQAEGWTFLFYHDIRKPVS